MNYLTWACGNLFRFQFDSKCNLFQNFVHVIVLPSHDENNTDFWDQIPASSPSFFPTTQNKRATITYDWFIPDFVSF